MHSKPNCEKVCNYFTCHSIARSPKSSRGVVDKPIHQFPPNPLPDLSTQMLKQELATLSNVTFSGAPMKDLGFETCLNKPLIFSAASEGRIRHFGLGGKIKTFLEPFWHFDPIWDQVLNSGPYWCACFLVCLDFQKYHHQLSGVCKSKGMQASGVTWGTS